MFAHRFSGFLALALALVSISLPASAQDIRTIERIDDADYFGFDLRTEKNVSIDECEASCIGDSSCRAFTYNPKVNWCFLKSDYDQLNSFPARSPAASSSRRQRKTSALHRPCLSFRTT